MGRNKRYFKYLWYYKLLRSDNLISFENICKENIVKYIMLPL